MKKEFKEKMLEENLLAIRHRLSLQEESDVTNNSTPLHARSSGHTLNISLELIFLPQEKK